MNQERQKTDAIADAVEIPEGATHYDTNELDYLKLDGDKWTWWCGNKWNQAIIGVEYLKANIKPL